MRHFAKTQQLQECLEYFLNISSLATTRSAILVERSLGYVILGNCLLVAHPKTLTSSVPLATHRVPLRDNILFVAPRPNPGVHASPDFLGCRSMRERQGHALRGIGTLLNQHSKLSKVPEDVSNSCQIGPNLGRPWSRPGRNWPELVIFGPRTLGRIRSKFGPCPYKFGRT